MCVCGCCQTLAPMCGCGSGCSYWQFGWDVWLWLAKLILLQSLDGCSNQCCSSQAFAAVTAVLLSTHSKPWQNPQDETMGSQYWHLDALTDILHTSEFSQGPHSPLGDLTDLSQASKNSTISQRPLTDPTDPSQTSQNQFAQKKSVYRDFFCAKTKFTQNLGSL